ncbi:MAG: hypothetical protein D3906_18600 [Candidatus Electrothrix sp. AUS1_2]|nr:hypothetical protein [Candidatus Electrothrix sp. AUS1_2]
MERVLKKYNEPEKKLDRDDCDVLLQRMRNAAQAVYEEYQHAHNPRTAPGCYDYGFHHDRSAFYVLDTRGQRDINRTSYRLLGKPQFQRFKKWVDGLDVKKTSCLFVTSAVPVLHMEPMLINKDDTVLARMAEVEDDLRDAWEHEAHRDERRKLMKVLFAAAERGIRVCILSGDVHIAAAFRMENKNGAVVHQLTSSALTYNKPRALGWLLGASVPDDGTTSDGYTFKRLALYRESNFALIKVNQKSKEIIFQIYGRQEAQHPSGDVRIPMTHSVAKLVLQFD